MAKSPPATTKLSTHTLEKLYLRDLDLVEEAIGKMSFTEAAYYHVLGRRPTAGQVAVLDAVLVTLMEHGLTPSAIATRMTALSTPEAPQAAIAAGLLSVGSQFVGTTEDAARLLDRCMNADEGFDVAARAEVEALRAAKQAIPGFGHHLHRPDDPRSPKLFQVALDQDGISGDHIRAMKRLGEIVDEVVGRHLTINATGATAAVLLDSGIPVEAMRGFAVVSRAAGLLAHLVEERQTPSAMQIWETVEDAIPYDGAAPVKKDH